VALKIFDKNGRAVKTLSETGAARIHAAEWDLSLDADPRVISFPKSAKLAPPGTYCIEVQAGPIKLSGEVRIEVPSQPKVSLG